MKLKLHRWWRAENDESHFLKGGVENVAELMVRKWGKRWHDEHVDAHRCIAKQVDVSHYWVARCHYSENRNRTEKWSSWTVLGKMWLSNRIWKHVEMVPKLENPEVRIVSIKPGEKCDVMENSLGGCEDTRQIYFSNLYLISSFENQSIRLQLQNKWVVRSFEDTVWEFIMSTTKFYCHKIWWR